MTLIIIDKEDMIELPMLLRLALKAIYEKDKLTFHEERQLHKSVIYWFEFLKNQKEISADNKLNTVDNESQIGLEIIASLLGRDENGEFDERKELFKRHDIDYKKFHRLSGSVTKKDIAKGQETLKQHMKDNPEDYV